MGTASEDAQRLALRARIVLVLCIDEKSQVQALDRTGPLLPMRPGIPAQQTHDYIRHGTTSLFAAQDVAIGKMIGQCHRRHRHQEFLEMLPDGKHLFVETAGLKDVNDASRHGKPAMRDLIGLHLQRVE